MKPECVKQTQNSKSDPIVDTQGELRNVGLVLGRERVSGDELLIKLSLLRD